jgi:molecular chaperone DnaK
MYVVGIDLGTTFTAAAVWRNGHAEIASLGSRAAVIPSVVLLRDDETVLTGETASRRGLTEPQRLAREFKRRLGDTTPILLGGVPYSAEALMARLLRSVLNDVEQREGGGPTKICISHPANWGPYKRELLTNAVRLANIDLPTTFVTEPEAAAIFYAQQQRVEPGATVAVYDLGGGTFDTAVLRKTSHGFELLGQPEGIERLGGIDFDAAVFAHVRQSLGDALNQLDEDDAAAMAAVARLREECVDAKEALSSDTDVSIPVLLPNLSTEVRLTRSELEAMVRPTLHSSIEALRRALRSAQVEPEDLHSVLLVGGSSRMPIVAQLVGAELGRPVAVDAHPKHAIALGAAWLASGVEPAPPAAPGAAGPATHPSSAPGGGAAAAAIPATGTGAATQAAATQAAGGLVGAGRRYTGSARVPGGDAPAGTDPGDRAATPPGGSADHTAMHMMPSGLAGGPGSPGGGPGGSPVADTNGSGRRRSLLVGGGVVAAAVVAAAIGWALGIGQGDDNGGPGGLPSVDPTTTGSPTPQQPLDEQCTDEIQANPRWVCLTSASFDAQGQLVVQYDVDWAGDTPSINGGFHLHVYGGDGTAPPDETMGNHHEPAGERGSWKVWDQDPIVLSPSDIGNNPKVCARIADSNHHLVPANDGSYTTGNCVRIDQP